MIYVFDVDNQIPTDFEISIKAKNSVKIYNSVKGKNSVKIHNYFRYLNPDSWEQHNNFSFNYFHHLIFGLKSALCVQLLLPAFHYYVVFLAQSCTSTISTYTALAEDRVSQLEEKSLQPMNTEGRNNGEIESSGKKWT